MKTHTYKRSPWGAVQCQHIVIEGLTSVSTAGHGGLKLSSERQKAMPDYMRSADGWYEEDCEWARVFVVFAAEIKQHYQVHPEDENAKYALASVDRAPESLKNWNPDAYEKFFNTQIASGQSYIREHPLKSKTT